MKNKFIIYFVLFATLSSCVSDDFFGYSPYAYIKSIEIVNQAKQAVIDTASKSIQVEFPAGVELDSLTIQSLSLSSFAVSDKNVNSILNLNESDTITVTAENGLIIKWSINPYVASATPQLENSDFNLWYQADGGFYEPGTDAQSTIWGTGNPGSNTINRIATTPLEIENDNFAVKMETLDNGVLGLPLKTPISAGSVFTGKFNSDKIDPTNPEAAIDFGTPFVARPLGFRFKYQYAPGPENKDRNGNLLNYSDGLDIYALLEVRDGNTVKRLATAWFRSDELVESLTSHEITFTYGELDASFPDYMRPANGMYVDGAEANYALPSHITLVASSSFGGAKFEGAVGSTLIFDDVELIYE